MPKNTMGGKNGKRGKKNTKIDSKRNLEFKEDGQEYAIIEKALGNGRFHVQCMDGKKRLGILRGKMRKKIWINQSDYVLVGLRDFQDDKCDIMSKYTPDEARNLKAYGELPPEAKINEDSAFNEEDNMECPFEFGDPSDEEDHPEANKVTDDEPGDFKINLDDI